MDISEQLFERAKRVLPGGVNSPVRAYRAVGMAPRFITRADGAYIYDEDGKRYIDYVCSWGPMILGHNHPVIREAVDLYYNDKEAWRGLQKAGMTADFSWDHSAQEYLDIYQRISG